MYSAKSKEVHNTGNDFKQSSKKTGSQLTYNVMSVCLLLTGVDQLNTNHKKKLLNLLAI